MADRTSLQPRSPYDWSLDRPGAALHIGPISQTIPADLDPHLAPCYASVPLAIRLERGRAERIEHTRALMIGITAAIFIAAVGAATITAAAIRLPQIEQQLAMQARI